MPHRRRRVVYHNGNGSVFNAGTAVNVFTIPVITAALSLVGWYFTTKDTLQRNTSDIAALQSTREKDRHEFGVKFDTMNESLNKLNTHAATQDMQTQTMNETLKTISTKLDGFVPPNHH